MYQMVLSNWKHRNAANYYSSAVKLFGQPNVKSNVPGGICIWHRHGNDLYREHVLKDESVRHCVPANHHDFFYSSVYFYVPPNKLNDVLRISGSINYDGLKKYLTARCGGLGANIATLYLGMVVASGRMSIDKVKKSGLYRSYIREEISPHSELENEMRELKRDNHRKYSKQLKEPFYALAFRKCS